MVVVVPGAMIDPAGEGSNGKEGAWGNAECRVRSGALSDFLLFTKINCTLAQFGQTLVDVPPDHPQFPALAAQNLVITNTAGVIAIRLTRPTRTTSSNSTSTESSNPMNRHLF